MLFLSQVVHQHTYILRPCRHPGIHRYSEDRSGESQAQKTDSNGQTDTKPHIVRSGVGRHLGGIEGRRTGFEPQVRSWTQSRANIQAKWTVPAEVSLNRNEASTSEIPEERTFALSSSLSGSGQRAVLFPTMASAPSPVLAGSVDCGGPNRRPGVWAGGADVTHSIDKDGRIMRLATRGKARVGWMRRTRRNSCEADASRGGCSAMPGRMFADATVGSEAVEKSVFIASVVSSRMEVWIGEERSLLLLLFEMDIERKNCRSPFLDSTEEKTLSEVVQTYRLPTSARNRFAQNEQNTKHNVGVRSFPYRYSSLSLPLSPSGSRSLHISSPPSLPLPMIRPSRIGNRTL